MSAFLQALEELNLSGVIDVVVGNAEDEVKRCGYSPRATPQLAGGKPFDDCAQLPVRAFEQGQVRSPGRFGGRNGVIAIDATNNANSAKVLLAEIAKVTSKPVTHVILTHSDGDHVNGLAGFPAGVTIIAHENCRKEMENSLNGQNSGISSPITVPRDRRPIASRIPTFTGDNGVTAFDATF